MDSARPGPMAGSSAGGPLVLDLGGTGTAPLQLVGGKALNLGKLLAAGLPVPRGFCLTTVAYELAEPPGLAALAAELDAPGSGAGPAAAGSGAGHCSAGHRCRTGQGTDRGSADPARGGCRRPHRLRGHGRNPAGGRPLLRHGGGPALRQFRRPAGLLPRRRRRRRRGRGGPALLGVPLERPGGGVPVGQRDQQPRRRARRRRPGHGRRRHGRGAVHRKPRHRDPDGDGHQREPGLGAGRGLGGGQPGPVRAGDSVRRGQESNAGRDGPRTRPGPGRAPAAGTHGAGRPRPAPPRGAAGHRMGDRRRRQDLAHPVTPDHHAVSAARSPRPKTPPAAPRPPPGCTSAAPSSRG